MEEETFYDLGINTKGRRSGNVKTRCPKCGHLRKHHPNDQSLSVEVSEGIWRCHHCGWTGGLNTGRSSTRYGSPLEHHESPRAYKKPSPPPTPTDHAQAALDKWLASRGISPQTAAEAGVTCGPTWMPQYDGEGDVLAIQFPYYRDGELVNIKYRAKNKAFKMVKDAELILGGLDWCRDAETVFLTEGEGDWLTLREAGFQAVLTVPNGAPPKPTNAQQQSSYNRQFAYLASGADIFDAARKVVLVTDADEPGEALRDELARRIGYVKCWTVQYPSDCKDINDVLVKYGVEAVRDVIAGARPYPVEGIILPDDLTDAVLALRGKNPFEGWLVGWPSVETLYRPAPQMITVVTGVPSSGKALALDTPIPTVSGWTTMGNIRVGDRVLDEYNNPCTVVATTDVMYGRPCYRIRFDDGTEVIADQEHEWPTTTPDGWINCTTGMISSLRPSNHHPFQVGFYIDPNIVACDPIESVPVRCIQVDSPSSLYLCTRAMIPTHNSKVVDAIALNLIEQYGYRIGFCSPENWPPQLHLRQMIQYRTGKSFMADPWDGGISEDDIRKEIDYLKDHVRFILPEKLSLDEIMRRAEVLVFRDGIQGLIIDPFTALSHNRPTNKSMPEYIAEFLTSLRGLARDNNLHAWIVAHPTKQVPILGNDGKFQTPVVDPYSIRDASAWFDLADFILSVHRDKGNPKAPVQLHVQKVRHQGYNGELGMAELYFDPVSYRYSEQPRGQRPTFGQIAA